MHDPPPVRSEVLGETLVIRLLDDWIITLEQIQRLTVAVDALLDKHAQRRVLLNLNGVKHLSSTALGMIVKWNRYLRQHDRRLILCDVSPKVRETLRVTQLARLFDIRDSQSDALGGESEG